MYIFVSIETLESIHGGIHFCCRLVTCIHDTFTFKQVESYNKPHAKVLRYCSSSANYFSEKGIVNKHKYNQPDS